MGHSVAISAVVGTTVVMGSTVSDEKVPLEVKEEISLSMVDPVDLNGKYTSVAVSKDVVTLVSLDSLVEAMVVVGACSKTAVSYVPVGSVVMAASGISVDSAVVVL